LEVKTIVEIKNGNDQAFAILKKHYEQAIKYIVLRKLKRQSYVNECLESIYQNFPIHANDYDQKRMNIGTWFLLYAKLCADEYSNKSLRRFNKAILTNGILVEFAYDDEYVFDYPFEFGYENKALSQLLSEEEYVIFYFREFFKLPFAVIAKILDLTNFSVNTFFLIAIRKIRSLSLIQGDIK